MLPTWGPELRNTRNFGNALPADSLGGKTYESPWWTGMFSEPLIASAQFGKLRVGETVPLEQQNIRFFVRIC